MINFPPLAAYLTSWACAMATIWFLFEKTEDTINAETKASISAWLKNVNVGQDVLSWPRQFSIVFDQIFGKTFFCSRFFFRSCIASTVASLISFCIWAGSHPDYLQYCLQYPFLSNAAAAAFLTVILNYVPDYVSLMESRWIIKQMTRTSLSRFLPLLVLDAILSAGIWMLGLLMMFVLLWVQDLDGSVISPTSAKMLGIMKNAVLFTARDANEMSVFGIYFYATFFTSVWVWLYAASGLTVKIILLVVSNVNRLLSFLDIDNKPLRAMGMIAMLMVTFIYLIVLALNFVARFV